MISTVGDQTTDVQRRLITFISTHRSIAFLDPPPNGSFCGVVRSIQNRMAIGIFPRAVESQARPEVPAIQKEIAHAVSYPGGLAFLGMRGGRIAFIQGLHLRLLIRLSGMNQFSQTT